MENKVIMIDGKRLELEKVAESGDLVLYRMPVDDRICGAPLMEVKERFPDYKFEPMESVLNSFLFEENGSMILYEPDGEIADGYETTTEEEINKVD